MLTGLAFESFFERVAASIAAAGRTATECSTSGADRATCRAFWPRRHGLDMTGVDLDPAMIERAQAKAGRAGDSECAGRGFWSATWRRWDSLTR